MASEGTHADALGIYLTGASSDGQYQAGHDLCLGGYRSSVRLPSLAARRLQPIASIQVLGVSGACGPGAGVIRAASNDSLAFTPPGGSEGAAVTLTGTQTRILEGTDPDCFVRVRRVLPDAFQGIETIGIVDLYGNAIGLDMVLSAQAVAGVVEHRALILKNDSLSTISDVKVWLGDCDGSIAIAKEAPSVGAIQTIATEATAPSGLSWNTGTTPSTGLSLGSMSAVSAWGLWIRRTIPADTSEAVSQLTSLEYSFVLDAVEYIGTLRGRYHIARDDAEYYGLWVGTDAEPDLTAPPDETYVSLPHTTAALLGAGHTYYLVQRDRDRFGLWSGNTKSMQIIVDASGLELQNPPSDPVDVTATAAGAGAVWVKGIYYPTPDGDDRADTWVIWYTDDGTDPDPDVDTPAAFVEMGRERGVEALNYTSTDTWASGTLVRAVARVRAIAPTVGTAAVSGVTQLPASGAGTIETGDSYADWAATGEAKIITIQGVLREIVSYSSRTDTVLTIDAAGRAGWHTTATAGAATDTISPIVAAESSNVDISQATITTTGPVAPRGLLFFGRAAAQVPVPLALDPGTTWIDQPNNIYFDYTDGMVSLYADTVLVWRYWYGTLYIPSEWSLANGSVSGATAETDPIEVAEWAAQKTLYVVVAGVRRMKIDITALKMTAASWVFPGTLPVDTTETPWLARAADTLFLVRDEVTGSWFPYLMTETDAKTTTAVGVNNTLTQAQVEAL